MSKTNRSSILTRIEGTKKQPRAKSLNRICVVLLSTLKEEIRSRLRDNVRAKQTSY